MNKRADQQLVKSEAATPSNGSKLDASPPGGSELTKLYRIAI